MAVSIVSVVQVVILLVMMSRHIKGLFDKVFIHAIARMASATGFMALVTYFSVTLLPLSATDQSFMASFPKFALIVAISSLVYISICRMLKLHEVEPILSYAKKITFGRFRRK